MTDALVTHTNKEEAISRAYVSAVAAGAGYDVGKTDFDLEGIDLSVHAGGPFRPRLDLQLKATINLGDAVDGKFRYPLKRRNYDLLRLPTMVPRVLVLIDLPKLEADWLVVTQGELVIRRCAYWASLVGFPETQNKESVTISLDYRNRFDVEGLKGLMDKARTGSIA